MPVVSLAACAGARMDRWSKLTKASHGPVSRPDVDTARRIAAANGVTLNPALFGAQSTAVPRKKSSSKPTP